MSPIQSSSSSSPSPSRFSDWDSPPPAPSTGLALPYLEHADLRAFAGASKQNRSRLEQKLTSNTANKLDSRIASIGSNGPVHEASVVQVAAEISRLDPRVARPLWQRLERRLIDMAECDIDNFPDSEKGPLLQKLVQFSSRVLPAASHGVVLAELATLASSSLVDPDEAFQALSSLFDQCRALPVQHREAPIRNLMLALPFTSTESIRPQIRQLIEAVQQESRCLTPVQKARIDRDLELSNATMKDFFATLEVVAELPAQDRKDGMANLIGHMLTVQHKHADALIANTLRYLSTEPKMIDAELLADLLPMVGLIEDASCRASRLQKVTQLAAVFRPDQRVLLLQTAAGVAVTLTESDRKKMLRTLYRGVPDMSVDDQTRALRAINMLGATIGAVSYAEVLITLPVALQATVKATLRAQTKKTG